MKNIFKDIINASALTGFILLLIQAILSSFLPLFSEKLNNLFLLAILISVYIIFLCIKNKTAFPDKFIGKLPYNMAIGDSKY